MAHTSNRKATASLVSSLIGWTLFLLYMWGTALLTLVTIGLGALCSPPFAALPAIGLLVGIVTGHRARREIRNTGQGGEVSATLGLALGYSGLALLTPMVLLQLAGVSLVVLVEMLGR